MRESGIARTSEQSIKNEYRFLFDNNPEPMLVYDVATLRFLAVNESAIDTYGYSNEEFLGMTLEQLCPAEDIPALTATLLKFESNPSIAEKCRHRKKDGSIIVVEVRSRATTFAGHKSRFMLMNDITERLKAEETLRLSEAKFRKLMETTTAAIFFYYDDRFHYVNQATERITGFSRDELSRKRLWELVHPDDREMVKGRTAAWLQSEQLPGRYEIRIATKAGDTRWLDLAAGLVQMENTTAILATGIDITDRKRAEHALTVSAAKLRTLMDATSAIIFFYRGEYFSYVNNALVQVTGYTKEELMRTRIWDLIHPEQREMVQQRALARQRGEDVPSRYELRILDKNGKTLWLDFTASVINVDGELALMGTAIDITEAKIAEEHLRSSEERFRALYEHNPLMCFSVSAQGIVQYINDAAVQHLGYSKDELTGSSILDVFLDEDKNAVLEHLQQCLNGDRHISAWELRKRHKNGNHIYVSEIAQVVHDQDGNPTILLVCDDVTERRHVQNMLRESEEKFRMLAESTSAGIFFYHHNTFSYANQAMERITGYTRHELQAMSFLQIVHPEHRTMVRRRATARRRGQELSQRYELKIVDKSGNTHWLDVAPGIIELNGNTVLMGTAVDITERKRVHEELRHSEELTHRILEAVPGGIIEVASNGRLLQANLEAQRFFGLTALEFMQRSTDELGSKFIWEDGSKVGFDEFPLAQCLETGEDQQPHTMGVLRPDGGISWAVFTAVPLTDIVTGTTNGAVLTFLDITGRKHTEDALRESEERYRKFFEEDLTGDYIASNDGCILACNPAFANIFGFESVDTAMYCNLDSIYTEHDTIKAITELLAKEKKVEYHEALGRRRDGHTVYIIENLIGLFDASGALIGVKGYVFDNTAHKTLELQVQEAAKIEGLGRLAGGIAHDFNNLLGIILGYSERLSTNVDGSAAVKHDIHAIHTAAQRGANLVKQLLTFARKTEVSFEEMNINSVVDELGRLLKETFPRNIALDINLDPSLPLIIGDANKIHQAVLNLCVNARDAMAAGGTLTLKTETVPGRLLPDRFPEPKAEQYACISVGDSGVGITEEIRSKIFEPFFSTKERGRGTGLGLAVVYGIVNAHHGIIDVASQTGKGASFNLYFPISNTSPNISMNEVRHENEAAGGTETILLVEDEELLRELAQSLLELKGYRVLTANDGEQAVDLYRQHYADIHLVLTDLGLPKLGGWEACQQMKAINPDVKVIVATGYLDPNAKHDMTRGGVQEFVQKPYLASELIAKIREMLDAGNNPHAE